MQAHMYVTVDGHIHVITKVQAHMQVVVRARQSPIRARQSR
jgi:hypothetical protein